MAINVNLSPEAEAKLLEKATRQGKDIAMVAAELLVRVLAWETQDSEEAVVSIRRGLDTFEVRRFRSFQEFADEQRAQYDLPTT